MSKKEKIQTVSWKDIQMVTTSDGREVYYFVTPNLEVFMDEDISNVESMICNDYHLADVTQDYLPVQNSKLYNWNKGEQYGYETNAELHSMDDCDEEDNRFRFYMNSPTLWGLLLLVKEYCIRRSSQKGIPKILAEVDFFITACMQSHDTFLTKYLPHERKMNGN